MSMNKLSPREWLWLCRLHRAGCMIDPEHLRAPNYPLLVISKEVDLPSQVFPAVQGVAFVLPLRLVAATTIRIADLRFEAEWLPGGSRWIAPCTTHPGRSCIGTASGCKSAKTSACLPERISARPVLHAGESIQGLLLGIASQTRYSSVPEGKLDALVHIIDSCGEDYPYPVSLLHQACPPAPDRQTNNQAPLCR